MTRLSLSLLGPLQITRGGQPVSGFVYNKARALLAYLAIEAARPHQRDALVGLLWPDLPDTAARTNLRQALANLREAIGDATATPPFLLITRDTIQFNLASDYELDGSAFIALLRMCEIHTHRHLGRCRSCAARREQAISLYRGDFLAEFMLGDSAPFEEWQLLQRERLHQHALDALTRLAGYHERRGENEQAGRYAQRQIELEPWREEAHRQLMRLLARGGQRSAALAQYATCRRLLLRDLGAEPEAKTTALYEQIRDSTLSIENEPLKKTATEQFSMFNAQFSISRQNFPASTTPLIGRATELADLGTLLENPACRLITVVGPGGIGKTRLALAAGINQAEEFADGAAFVPLQAISAAAFVAPAILGALGVTVQGQRDPREQLRDYLRERELLLVLDNFEQVIDAAPLVGNLLAAAPQLTILITSRSVLRLSGEHEYVVAALRLPGNHSVHDPTALARIPAVDLFVQRSQMVQADFRLNAQNAAAVAVICQRLDGLPLAIELAAARIKLFTPAALLTRLDQRLALLTQGPRDLPMRQQTLRATLDWSYNLLEDADRTLFARLGVFVGGWTLEAAETVCVGGGGWEVGTQLQPRTPNSLSPTPALEGLARLIDHSLVRQDTSAHGETRFAMLETIREYALEHLTASGDEQALRQEHLVYLTMFAERIEPDFRGPRARTVMDSVEIELPNVRAALIWSQTAPDQIEYGLRLASALLWFWDQRSVAEGNSWLKRVLSQPEAARPTAGRAKALSAACYSAEGVGDYSEAHVFGAEALTLARSLRDPARIAWALCHLGLSRRVLPDQRIHGMAQLEESLILFKDLNDHFGMARALWTLGDATYGQGDTARSIALQEESLARSRAIGDQSGAADPLRSLGNIALEQGNVEHAVTLCEESLALCREVGDSRGVADALRVLGRAELKLGNLERAAARHVESMTIFRHHGAKPELAWAHNDIGTLARFDGRYDEATACYSESMALFVELDRQDGIAMVRYNQGFLAYMQGDDVQADLLLRESLTLSQSLQRPTIIARCLTGLGGIAARCRRFTDAALLLGAAEALLVARGSRRDFAARADYQQIITPLRAQYDEATFAAAWAEGQAMTLEQSLADTLEDSEVDSASSIIATAAPQ